MPIVELEDVNGQLDEFDVDLDGLGRIRRIRGRGRRNRREARLSRRIQRLTEKRMRIGRTSAYARQYRLPDGRVVCPSPSDMVYLSDEPLFDVVALTDLSTWPQDQPFFDTRTRTANGVALTNLLQIGRANYDMDIESVAVSFHASDAGAAAINQDQQSLLEMIGRGVFEYRVQEKDNTVWPVSDCPAGSGVWAEANTTQTNMRTLAIQNGSPAKGRRRLTQTIPIRKATSFSGHLHTTAADRAAMAALTNDPTRQLLVRAGFYGPEAVPLVPSSAGGLMQAQGVIG